MHNHILSCDKKHQNPNENDILTARYHRSDKLLWAHVVVSLPARPCINNASVLRGSGWSRQTKWGCTVVIKIQVVILLQLSLCLDHMCVQGTNCMQIWKANVWQAQLVPHSNPLTSTSSESKHCPPSNHQHLNFSASGTVRAFPPGGRPRVPLRAALSYDCCDLLC